MTDVKNNDIAKVISMTQFEFQLELDKARLEQKALDDELLKRVHKGVLDKAITEKKELIDKACDEFKNAITMLGVEYDIPNVIKDKYHINFRRAIEER